MITITTRKTATALDQPGLQLELWGGVESTVNRVGDRWFDQSDRSGHTERLDDLDRIAALGIRTLRYPLLWERIAPRGLASADWSWSDRRMERLRELGIRPIAGLVHHGSGPEATNLLDPGFAPGLATFARAVAERYPWIDAWTPVNEPLTTARFSALYGHWYPHATNTWSFLRALVNQVEAVRLAMREIRGVIPGARLVQTEDLGKTWSTEPLAYQADYENARSWLSLDLLTGAVNDDHWFRPHLVKLGIGESELATFVAEPCPPDIIGLNYYLTSERFLDHRFNQYSPRVIGGNGQQNYADVEAVRVLPESQTGLVPLLQEAWNRYNRPVALTELHLGCTREEQLRWLANGWRDARTLRERGVDFRAVTIWSLFGAYDWNSLVTRDEGFYEPGAFDLRAPQPRPTALARLAKTITDGQQPKHPLLDQPGWWVRSDRFVGGAALDHQLVVPTRRGRQNLIAPLLITGANGLFGRALLEACARRGIAARAVRNPDSRAILEQDRQPWAVIDARLRNRRVSLLDGRSEGDPELTNLGLIADHCAGHNLPLLAVSSVHVFDGTGNEPYRETHLIAPRDAVGTLQATVENTLLTHWNGALIVRAAELLGPGMSSWLPGMRKRLEMGLPIHVDDTAPISATYLPDLANVALDLLIDGETGIWHLPNMGVTNRADLLRAIAERIGADPSLIHGAAPGAIRGSGPVSNTALASDRGWPMPSLDQLLNHLFRRNAA